MRLYADGVGVQASKRFAVSFNRISGLAAAHFSQHRTPPSWYIAAVFSDTTMMMNQVHEMNAYLCVKSVDAAIDFYSKAFGATEELRLTGPDGRVGHAEFNFGDRMVMFSEEFPEMGVVAPSSDDTSCFSLYLRVEDADAMFNAAVTAGARVEQALQDQFYGERSGTLRDPFGYKWMLGYRIEELSSEEMQDRYLKLFEGG